PSASAVATFVSVTFAPQTPLIERRSAGAQIDIAHLPRSRIERTACAAGRHWKTAQNPATCDVRGLGGYHCMIAAHDWSALNRLLDTALALPVEQRSAWIETLDGEHAGMKALLRQLLERSDLLTNGDFLATLSKLSI